MSRIPNLFLIGAPRCGTTSIYSLLKSHPNVFCSPVKEPNFFCSDLDEYLPPRFDNVNQYKSLFAQARSEKYILDASAHNIQSDIASKRIKDFTNGNAKIIVILRNPVDMLHSLFYRYKNHGTIASNSFVEFIHEQRSGHLNDCFSFDDLIIQMPKRLESFIDEFGYENCLFLSFQAFTQNQQIVIDKIEDFLKIKKNVMLIDKMSINSHREIRSLLLIRLLGGGKPGMLTGLNATLRKFPYIYPKVLSFRNFIMKYFATKHTDRIVLTAKQKEFILSPLRPSIKKIEALTNIDLSI